MTENKTLDIVLESCPFCGGEATLDTRRDEKRRENPTYVKCSCCGARTRTFSRVREAIAAWNRCAKEHKRVGHRNWQVELLQYLLKIDTGTLKGVDHENR